jgi:threonine dehydrogenase-like Zn-dependent dehydrogenase
MRALSLEADWKPRPGYTPLPHEVETRQAVRANSVWHAPRFELGEKPVPAISDEEVLIKVRACGVCGSDTHFYETDEAGYALFSGSAKLPVTPGHEYAGEVVEVGRKVMSLRVGDAVVSESMIWCGHCIACRSGHPNQCRHMDMLGFSLPGAFADYVAIDARYCWTLDDLPEAFPEEDALYEAAALVEPIGCAYNGIFVAGGGFQPGAYVAIYGAGPIGLGAVLLARMAGAAKVFVFDLSEPRNALALELGADYAANPVTLREDGTSPAEVILEMTRGQGADLQVEASGAARATFPEIERSLAPNGKMIYLGRLDASAPLTLDTMVSQANRIVGARGQSGYGIYPSVIRLLASGRLPARRMITSRFPLDGAIDAICRAAERRDGKVMIRVS